MAIMKQAELLEFVRQDIRKRRLSWKSTLKKLRELCRSERKWWQQRNKQERLARKESKGPKAPPKAQKQTKPNLH